MPPSPSEGASNSGISDCMRFMSTRVALRAVMTIDESSGVMSVSAIDDELAKLQKQLIQCVEARKDYKEITASGVKCGFCAIYGALESISGNLMEEAEKFRTSRQLDHLVIMSAYYEDEELRKELALLPDCNWNQEALAYLNSKGVQLEPKNAIGSIQVYNQRNTNYSRKQILPFIKELIE